MKLPAMTDITSAGEAESLAIEYQNWASEQSLSYSELADYSGYFEALGRKFNLTDVFKENGVI